MSEFDDQSVGGDLKVEPSTDGEQTAARRASAVEFLGEAAVIQSPPISHGFERRAIGALQEVLDRGWRGQVSGIGNDPGPPSHAARERR